MRFYEFKTTKPLTPQQARINALKQQKERASTQLKAEKDRQKKQKAVSAIQQNNQVLAKLKTP
jgi:hypothetical protein